MGQELDNLETDALEMRDRWQRESRSPSYDNTAEMSSEGIAIADNPSRRSAKGPTTIASFVRVSMVLVLTTEPARTMIPW